MVGTEESWNQERTDWGEIEAIVGLAFLERAASSGVHGVYET